jgi:hypothetical protein
MPKRGLQRQRGTLTAEILPGSKIGLWFILYDNGVTKAQASTKLAPEMLGGESGNGHYRVRLDGEWVDVPDEAVITEPNRVGRTIAWPLRGYLGLTIDASCRAA